MRLSDFFRIARNRSLALAIDEWIDFIVFDLIKRYDFSNRDPNNRDYVPSPSKVIRRAFKEIEKLDDTFSKDFFVDCAAGKGKPSIIALESGFKSFLAIERDKKIFEVLTANIAQASKRFSLNSSTKALDDFLLFDTKAIQAPEDSYLTFWLYDLKESLPSFFHRINELCTTWGVQRFAVLLLSEVRLPPFEGWDRKTSIDFGYDDSRTLHIFSPIKN